jgi:hypothetical protein
MIRYRGVLDTVPGRVTLRVRVPDELLAEADRIAHQRGVDRAIVLGDLVAAALPDALADAARELLASFVSLNAATGPGCSPDPATNALTYAKVGPYCTGTDRDQATSSDATG